MKITSQDFEHGQWIPSECAYGQLVDGKFALAENLNPQLSWSGLPQGTQSIVLACIDPDVPTDRKALNEDGVSVLPNRWELRQSMITHQRRKSIAATTAPVLRDSTLACTATNSGCMRLM